MPHGRSRVTRQFWPAAFVAAALAASAWSGAAALAADSPHKRTTTPADSSQGTADDEQPPAAGSLTDDAVRAAVARAIEYLKKTQDDSGLFVGPYAGSMFKCGETALALLAMRCGGVGLTDPAYQKGEKALLELTTPYTYEVSLMAQVFALVPLNKVTPAMRRKMTQQANYLCTSQLPNGMWTYPLQQLGAMRNQQAVLGGLAGGDNSNTQFGVLALWQLAEAGIEFDYNALRKCETHFTESQLANGGWSYMPPWPQYTVPAGRVPVPPAVAPARPSMTATGLASLYIFSDLLHLKDEGAFSGRAAPNCGTALRLDTSIDKALVQAEKDFQAFMSQRQERTAADPDTGRLVRTLHLLSMQDLYYLYSVERVGAASGQKHLGAIDWYAAGADLLLKVQNSDGSWGANVMALRPDRGNVRPPAQIVETALAVLFLAKGRAPLFYSKLRYDGDWNDDRRDVANVVRYAGKALEQPFNWLIVDVKSDLDGWFDSPVLYITGHDRPRFLNAEKKKLADYIRRGGFIFAEACCGQTKFADAMKELAAELWPGLQWQALGEDHPLFTRKSHFDLAKHPKLMGLTDQSGFTFFVLSTEDVSCVWHENLITTREEAFRFAINVYRHALRGKPIRARLER